MEDKIPSLRSVVKLNTILCFLSMLLTTYGCGSHYVERNGSNITFYLKNNSMNKVSIYLSTENYIAKNTVLSDNYWAYTTNISQISNSEIKYYYKINEEEYLPDCPKKELDDFGGKLCIYP